MELKSQVFSCAHSDLVCFGDDAHIGFVQLCSGLGVGTEHGMCRRGTQASDGTAPGVALFQQGVALERLQNRLRVGQAGRFNHQIGETRHASLQSRPKELLQGL